jgi:uncharacterized protein (TIGR03435 family)
MDLSMPRLRIQYRMIQYARIVTVAAAGVALLSGQTPQPETARPAEFEVASIRPSNQTGPAAMLSVGLHIDGAQVRCTYMSLNDYIGIGYKLKNFQINGPDWLKSERFDIAAKIPEGVSREHVPEMLRNLIETRFHVKSHREPKPLPVYALVVAKGGLKISPVAEDPIDPNASFDVKVSGSREGVSLSLGKAIFSIGNNKLDVKRMPMPAFADLLARFMDRPVLDMTDTKGSFDYTLDLAPEDFRAMTIRSAIAAGVTLPPEALKLIEAASDSSLHTALQAVGLKLEARKAPVDTLVIDSVQKTPTEN